MGRRSPNHQAQRQEGMDCRERKTERWREKNNKGERRRDVLVKNEGTSVWKTATLWEYHTSVSTGLRLFCEQKNIARDRHTVALAFRHTLCLLNIWPVHGSYLREVDQPAAALSGPQNIDRQQKEKGGFKDSNILQEPYVLLSTHPFILQFNPAFFVFFHAFLSN